MTEYVAPQITDLQYDFSKKAANFFVLFLLLYEISTYISNDMIMPGMIDVIHSFKASDNFVSTSLTAFILGGASLQIFLGPLSDRFGRRPVMLVGVLLFLFCNLFIASSQSIGTFILARFFQGMGLCFISVIGYATLQEIFSDIYAVRLISIMGNITILAPLLGPLLGSCIILWFSWRTIFHIIAVMTVIAFVGLWLFMPETVGIRRLDGTSLNQTAFNLTTIKNNYFSLLKNKRFMGGALSQAIATIPIIAWIGTSPLMLMKGAHLSVLYYGLLQIPIFVTAIFGSFVMRLMTYRLTLGAIATQGSKLLIGALILLSFSSFIFHNHYLAIIFGISLYSFALGIINSPLSRITLYSTIVPKGTASALISLMVMVFSAIGNQVAGFVYSVENNLNFAIFCTVIGLIYLLIYAVTFTFKT